MQLNFMARFTFFNYCQKCIESYMTPIVQKLSNVTILVMTSLHMKIIHDIELSCTLLCDYIFISIEFNYSFDFSHISFKDYLEINMILSYVF